MGGAQGRPAPALCLRSASQRCSSEAWPPVPDGHPRSPGAGVPRHLRRGAAPDAARAHGGAAAQPAARARAPAGGARAGAPSRVQPRPCRGGGLRRHRGGPLEGAGGAGARPRRPGARPRHSRAQAEAAAGVPPGAAAGARCGLLRAGGPRGGDLAGCGGGSQGLQDGHGPHRGARRGAPGEDGQVVDGGRHGARRAGQGDHREVRRGPAAPGDAGAPRAHVEPRAGRDPQDPELLRRDGLFVVAFRPRASLVRARLR
mmetsp:Transcript_125432/g.340598  ORF Transcript_125432/g.340598 Transcript_125432/m.340598 type:complete len:258 (-) Transcript_125432:7-780(-)